MNIFTLINKSKLALSKEDEFKLSSRLEQVINRDSAKINKKLNHTNVFSQIFIFFKNILADFVLIQKKCLKSPIYIFAGSINQFNSLQTLLKALKKNKNDFSISLTGQALKNKISKNTNPIKINLKVGIVICILFFSRGLPILFKLKKNKKIFNYLYLFFNAYIYVPFFLDLLSKSRPKLIIVSNDHNVDCRSLRLSAEILGIKTIYIQHASVGNMFPSLEFDYAFLDGVVAYKTYLRCFQNNIKTTSRVKKNVANCKVILTGQKKIIKKKENNKKKNLLDMCIGIAFNPLDDFSEAKKLLDHLSKAQLNCILRTHPSQDLIFTNQIKNYAIEKKWLSISDPFKQPLFNFFKKSNVIISSASSIHLEANLAHIPTFYFRMNKKIKDDDPYHYIKNGLTKILKSNFSIEKFKKSVKNYNYSVSKKKIIKNYSETYETNWQNNEGELCKIVVNRILNKKPLDDLFQVKKSSIYNSLSLLRKL